jgi:peptide/nickel transport system substrate-binding protein
MVSIVKSVALSFAALVVLVSTAQAGRLNPKPPSVLRVRLNADILSSDPGTRRDENTDAVLMHVVEGLVAYREDGTVGPMLAQSWTVSSDNMTWRFNLRRDVYFHDGRRMTSAEAMWSIKRYLGMGSLWRCGGETGPKGLAPIIDVSAPSSDQLVIRTAKPAPLLLEILARPDCGETAILSPSSLGPDGRWKAPIGTGPFRFGIWKRNQSVQLLRFAGYRSLPGPRDGFTGGKQALVDQVRFLVIPDSSAAVGAVLRGSLDVLDSLATTDLGALRDRKGRLKSGIRIESAPTEDIYAILLQTSDPMLRDIRMRQAIALSVDAKALARAVGWGLMQPNTSFISRISPYYKAGKVKMREADIARARGLAAASGYRGQPIHLVANHRYPMMFDNAVLVQAMARQAGIHIVIDTMDWGAELDHYSRGDYQMMSFAYSARMDPAFTLSPIIGDKAADPRKLWSSPHIVSLFNQVMQSHDPAVRQPLFDQLDAAFQTDVPALVLFNSTRIAAIRANITGFQGWRTGLPRYWGVAAR